MGMRVIAATNPTPPADRRLDRSGSGQRPWLYKQGVGGISRRKHEQGQD
jgi:hypothetical protein